MQFVSNNILPIFIAVFSGTMLLWSLFGNRFRGIKEVDPAAALQLINHKNAVVLDVREPSEYDAGHVLNSKLIPLGKLKERMGELDKYKGQPIVVVCRSGNRVFSFGIPNHNIGVASDCENTLAWIEAEDLCGIGRHQVHPSAD